MNIIVTEEDNGQTVNVSRHDSIHLVLEESKTTPNPYHWHPIRPCPYYIGEQYNGAKHTLYFKPANAIINLEFVFYRENVGSKLSNYHIPQVAGTFQFGMKLID